MLRVARVKMAFRLWLGLALLAHRSMAEMTCEGSCSPILTDACKEGISDSCTAEKKNDEEEKYNTCVAACENAAAEAAAAAGGISGEPKCYQDMVECGLSTTFNTIEEAEDMFADLLGCITLRYTSSTLGELCQEHVEEVGMDEILKCVGIATDLCGVPELTDDAKKAMKSPEGVDVTSLIPDQIVCMASNLENIGHESETCQELVQSLITIEEIVLDAARAHGLLDDDTTKESSIGEKDEDDAGESSQGNDLSSTQQVTFGALIGLAIGVLVCAFLATMKAFNWTKDFLTGSGDPDQFGGMELPPARNPMHGQQAVKARDFDFDDDDDDENDI